MKNFKEFSDSINEELKHSTYKNAANKLKKLGHHSRSKTLTKYTNDKYKISNDIVRYIVRTDIITTIVDDINIKYDETDEKLIIYDSTYYNYYNNGSKDNIIVEFRRSYNYDNTYTHSTYITDRKSARNIDKLIKRFLMENELDIDLNYTINSLYREHNIKDINELHRS